MFSTRTPGWHFCDGNFSSVSSNLAAEFAVVIEQAHDTPLPASVVPPGVLIVSDTEFTLRPLLGWVAACGASVS
ncbi:MAG: hypothetical protein EXS41_06945 [Opitutaceae bacterium]|nr:hypothetical protein [Opitutaceae bacterium]